MTGGTVAIGTIGIIGIIVIGINATGNLLIFVLVLY
jgi:hypothetical protein